MFWNDVGMIFGWFSHVFGMCLRWCLNDIWMIWATFLFFFIASVASFCQFLALSVWLPRPASQGVGGRPATTIAPENHFFAIKVGHRSSSLSWTVQINRNRSRPGADRVRFGIDLAPRSYFSWFWNQFSLILGPFLIDFSKDFQWILGLILGEIIVKTWPHSFNFIFF